MGGKPMPKILVVDDEGAILDLILAVLEDDGYATIGARGGAQALALLATERPDLVLMDIMMPGMDGREVFRRMRDGPDAVATPVVMMSAAYARERVPVGVAAFLTKPFDIDHLLATVARTLRSP